MLDLLRRRPKPQPPFQIAGTMNYLHEGARAPQRTVKTAQGYKDQDTTWRLLWRDDRYIDGTVPGEETHYRFTRPHPFQSRPTTINPQEALLLEQYTSVPYFEKLRDIWGQMVAQVEQSLRRFMQSPPADYRKRTLPEQPDIVWGGLVLPNFRDTYRGLCEGCIQLGEQYDERVRGPRVAPAIWPEYRLNPTITVVTGAKPPRAGIYLPDLHDSCLQFLVDDMPAPEALVFRGKRDLAHPVTDVVYGQENSFDRLPCRWTLVERVTDELKH
jgi:hypothetical protein